uniref:Putative ovule protein n=1 Tax=Solanum chacoense TaxID=4108 RepID=A0A0V0GH14_SOLCH
MYVVSLSYFGFTVSVFYCSAFGFDMFLRLILPMGRIYFFFVRFQMYLSFVFLYHCVFELNLGLFGSFGATVIYCFSA